MTRRFIAFISLLVTLLSGAALAQDQPAVSVEASVSAFSVPEGQRFRLRITVEGSDTPQQPDLSALDGFTAEFAGGGSNNRSSVVIVNGRMQQDESRGYVFNYTLTANKVGNLTIPAIPVVVDAKTYTTRPLTIRVTPPSEDPDVKFTLTLDPPNPYVGEPSVLRVKLLLQRNLQDVDLTFRGVDGVLSAPRPERAQQGMMSSTLDILGERVTTRNAQETIDGVNYYTFTAERTVIPLKPGSFEVGATLSGDVVLRQGDGFFDTGERRTVSVPCEPLRFSVRDLPSEGRPANFSNLVGRFTVSASADPVSATVGDPITLKITVNGQGPMDRVPPPNLRRQLGADRFRIPDDMASPELRPGQVLFTQTIRPLSESVNQIPPIEVPFFDTRTGKYETARSSAIPLRISPARVVTAQDAVAAAGAKPRPAEIESREGGLEANIIVPAALTDQRFNLRREASSPALLAVAAGPGVLSAGAWAAVALRARRDARPSAQRRRRALARAQQTLARTGTPDSTASTSTPAAAVSRALCGYVADRFDLADTLTTKECHERLLAIDPALADRARAVLERCDAARFAGLSSAQGHELAAEAGALLAALEQSRGKGAA